MTRRRRPEDDSSLAPFHLQLYSYWQKSIELPRVLLAILDFFKFLWTFFTGESTEPIRPVDQHFSPKPIRLVNLFLNQPSSPEPNRLDNPFRLLDLPSLAHDVIFSEMHIKELYQLSRFSRRSRYAVKMFTRRQKYDFSIHAKESHCSFEISNRLGRTTFHRTWIPMKSLDGFSLTTHSEDVWAATKEKILYFLDVFTKKVNHLEFHDITNIKKMKALLKEKTALPIDWVLCDVSEIDDEMYKYVLKEFKDAKELSIRASPSPDFRFDDMEPLTGDSIWIRNADWLTVDHLTRCFTNVERVQLWTDCKRYLNVLVFNQFLNAWRNGLRVGKLDLVCYWTNFDLQSIFKNVPTTEVKRVQVGGRKTVFDDGKCFLIRQEESGVEAIVYFNNNYTFMNHSICFTTSFRLLRDDESD